MSDIQRADPEARRRALIVLVFMTAVGGLLIAAFEHFRGPLGEWMRSDPAQTTQRAKWIVFASALLLVVPALGIAVYLWRLGARVLAARRFPPTGVRVIRDTPIVEGDAAAARGQALQILAVCLGVGACVLCLFFLYLTRMQTSHPI